MRDFHNLDVWKKAHQFTLDVFHASETFPKGEVFQLAATLRRGAMLVSMRIAEACGQDASVDFAQSLSRARSMGMEVEYSLLLAKDLQFLKPELHDQLCAQLIEVRRMLSGLMKSAGVASPEKARQ